MSDLLRELGGTICGQVHPLDGPFALPLCARCTGLYLVLGLTSIAASFIRERKTPLTKTLFATALLLIAASPLHVHLDPQSSDSARLIVGALTGAGLAVLLRISLIDAIVAAVIVNVSLLAARSELAFGTAYFLIPFAVLAAWGRAVGMAMAVFFTAHSRESRDPFPEKCENADLTPTTF